MNELAPIAQMALGLAWQWTRAPKHVPNWLGYALFCGLSVVVWFWMTPTAQTDVLTDWRKATASIISFALSARGSASLLSDAKAAPKTDSI